jgi:hypothetical protein
MRLRRQAGRHHDRSGRALGLAAVDIITLSSLHSYLYGRVDDQLTTASHPWTAAFVARADERGFAMTPTSITRSGQSRHLRRAHRPGRDVTVARPSGTAGPTSTRPSSPPTCPGTRPVGLPTRQHAYHPSSASINVGSTVGTVPEYRLQATSLPGPDAGGGHQSLAEVNATLASLRTIELAVSLGLLVALSPILMTLLIRLGLRPLEDMAGRPTPSPPAT